MFEVAALYKFSKILDPFKTHNSIRSKLKDLSVYGTILVGGEGLNATISAVNKKNLSNILYTEISSNSNIKSDVTIVDVMGRLLDFYEIADCVFIGGTLVDHGGQNFLEPAFFNKPIISGRSTYNFDEISKKLSDLGLLKFVSNKDEISSVVESIEAISDSLKKDTNLWLNENKGASKFISKKICKEFNLV